MVTRLDLARAAPFVSGSDGFAQANQRHGWNGNGRGSRRRDRPPELGGIGAQLRAAREARGLTLEQVAAETRIPQRHLQTIEAGDFAALPARTYAIGFSRTYARLVGLDEDEVADDGPRRARRAASPAPRHRGRRVRAGRSGAGALARARLALGRSRWCWCWRACSRSTRRYFSPAAELPSLVEQEEAEQAAAAARSAQRRRGAGRRRRPAARWCSPRSRRRLGQVLRRRGRAADAEADGARRALHRARRCREPAAVDRPARCAVDHRRRPRRCPSSPRSSGSMRDVPVTAAGAARARPAPRRRRAAAAASPTT